VGDWLYFIVSWLKWVNCGDWLNCVVSGVDGMN
jgi:hypothetical protein